MFLGLSVCPVRIHPELITDCHVGHCQWHCHFGGFGELESNTAHPGSFPMLSKNFHGPCLLMLYGTSALFEDRKPSPEMEPEVFELFVFLCMSVLPVCVPAPARRRD